MDYLRKQLQTLWAWLGCTLGSLIWPHTQHERRILYLLRYILIHGDTIKNDRTGVGTKKIFGWQIRFPMKLGFPQITTRRLGFKFIAAELAWFLKGSTDNNELKAQGVNIWTPWENERGELGPIYGEQWRAWKTGRVETEVIPLRVRLEMLRDRARDTGNGEVRFKCDNWLNELSQGELSAEAFSRAASLLTWYDIPETIAHYETVDQFEELIENLKKKPFSRRHVVSGWNPAVLPDESKPHAENIANGKAVLPPCHTLMQFNVRPCPHGGPNILDLQLYQRSCDVGVGGVANVPSYSLLLMLVAHVTHMVPGDFVWSLGDAHIYLDQVELIKQQLKRRPRAAPTLYLGWDVVKLDDFTTEKAHLVNYDPHPALKFPVAV